MTNELSTERAIEALYTVRAYYASLTAGYPKGKDRRGIGDVMCSEIANSCLMAIKALEQSWIPVSERLPQDEQKVLVTTRSGNLIDVDTSIFYHASAFWEHYVIAWMPLPEPYEAQKKECADCKHYGKLSLDCGRCDDNCSMFAPQESEE